VILGAIYGLLAWAGLILVGRLILVHVFRRTPGPVASVSVGFGALVACAVVFAVVQQIRNEERVAKSSQQERDQKSEFLRQLCADRRAKGEVPGAGC
jgi:hypothetical protein